MVTETTTTMPTTTSESVSSNRFVLAMAAKPGAGDDAPLPNVLAMSRWKRAKVAARTEVVAKRLHKDIDRVWKRLCRACLFNHSLCAGILTRGVPGYTRAQTVMVLLNGFAFELIMLCLFFSSPPPNPINNITGLPYVPEGATVVINPVAIIFGATVAAAICIPMMLIFSWAFDPIIYVNVSRNLLRMFFCWPLWVKQRYCPKPEAADVQLDDKEKDKMAEMRKIVDLDGDGKLSQQELDDLKEDLNTDATLTDFKKMLDQDGDGKITDEELERLLQFSSEEEQRVAEAKVSKVQAMARGVSVRSRLNAERAEQQAILAEQQAALKLQMFFRRRRAMQLWALALNHKKEGEQASMLQRAWARRLARVAHNTPLQVEDIGSPPPSPPEDEEEEEEPERLSFNDARRSYNFDSLNEGLLKMSLSETWKAKDWPQE